jgi:hypothetical protein
MRMVQELDLSTKLMDPKHNLSDVAYYILETQEVDHELEFAEKYQVIQGQEIGQTRLLTAVLTELQVVSRQETHHLPLTDEYMKQGRREHFH